MQFNLKILKSPGGGCGFWKKSWPRGWGFRIFFWPRGTQSPPLPVGGGSGKELNPALGTGHKVREGLEYIGHVSKSRRRRGKGPEGGEEGIFSCGGIFSLRISNLNTNFPPPPLGGGFFSRFSPQKNAFLGEISTKMTPIC